MDSLGVRQARLVGLSFAGAELTRLAAASRDSVVAFERDVFGPCTDASIARFRRGGGGRCAVELDAVHHVFLHREHEVVALVRDFLRSRRVPCG